MKNHILLFTFLFCLPFAMMAQVDFYYPIDVEYNESLETYYVSNSAEGVGGFVLRVNTSGEIIDTLFSDLDYAGGMCVDGDVLYVIDNGDQWEGSLPSYVVAVDVHSGAELFRTEISTGGTYLGLMTTDHNGTIYITDNEKMCLYKYTIESQTSEKFVSGVYQPHGIYYDHLEDRIVFTENLENSSRLKSVRPDGGDIRVLWITINFSTSVYLYQGWMKGIVMNDAGEYFISTWEWENAWGDESVYRLNHELTGDMVELMTGLNRPYGMCIGHDEHLAICAWGGHEVAFFDLNPFGTKEAIARNERLEIYPNPGNGSIKIRMPDIQAKQSMMSILDLSGRIISELSVGQNQAGEEVSLDLSGLPSGMYVVMMQGGNTLYREKLVIQ